MFDELQKKLDEQFKEMHDNIVQFMKIHEAEKHKANQLQKNIISENNDIRDNIPFPPTTVGSDVSKPYQQDTKLSNDDTKSLSLNEKLDANQSFPLHPHLIVANQRKFWQQLFLSSKTDCSQSAEDIVFPHPNPDCIKSDHSLNTDPECLLLSNIQLTEKEDDCRQPVNSSQFDIHLPRLSDTDSLSSATIDMQNMHLHQFPPELKEID